MGEYSVLFCLSNSISNIKRSLQDYCSDKDFSFQIQQVSCYEDFLNIEDISKFHCVVIQEYLSKENPVDVEFLAEYFPKNIIVIGIFHEDKRQFYGKELYKNKLYNCFFGEDANKILVRDLASIILNGRSKDAAKMYYNISSKEDVDDNKEHKSEISDNKNVVIKKFKAEKKIMSNHNYNSLNIGIANLSSGAGSTFFAMNLASYLSRETKVTLIEHPSLEPYMYYYLGLNALCSQGYTDFHSVFHLLENGGSVQDKEYVSKDNKNLRWIFADPYLEKIDNWNEDSMMRLLYYPKESNMNIVDIGQALFHNSIYNIVEQFKVMFIVVDPMLPNLLLKNEYLNSIKEFEEEKGVQVEFVINKYASNIQKTLLEDFIGRRLNYYIPQIDMKYIYEAVYYGIISLELKEVNKLISPVLDKLSNRYLNLQVKKKRFLF